MSTDTEYVPSQCRAPFVVLEGLDRAGKTSLKSVVERLMKDKGESIYTISFPDRTTETGVEIDAFLRKRKSFKPMEVHELYGKNRTEKMSEMEKLLREGTCVVCDRYVYSGCAYTLSNIVSSMTDFPTGEGISKMCQETLKKLCVIDLSQLIPDAIINVTTEEESEEKRDGFGDEIYETRQFSNLLKTIGYPETYNFYSESHRKHGTKTFNVVNKTDTVFVDFYGEQKPKALIEAAEKIVDIIDSLKRGIRSGATKDLERYSDHIRL